MWCTVSVPLLQCGQRRSWQAGEGVAGALGCARVSSRAPAEVEQRRWQHGCKQPCALTSVAGAAAVCPFVANGPRGLGAIHPTVREEGSVPFQRAVHQRPGGALEKRMRKERRSSSHYDNVTAHTHERYVLLQHGLPGAPHSEGYCRGRGRARYYTSPGWLHPQAGAAPVPCGRSSLTSSQRLQTPAPAVPIILQGQGQRGMQCRCPVRRQRAVATLPLLLPLAPNRRLPPPCAVVAGIGSVSVAIVIRHILGVGAAAVGRQRVADPQGVCCGAPAVAAACRDQERVWATAAEGIHLA